MRAQIADATAMMRQGITRMALILSLVMLAGSAIGIVVQPGASFYALEYALWAPQPRALAAISLIGYILAGLVGWDLWWSDQRMLARWMWALQMSLMFAWPITLFGLRALWPSFAILFLLWMIMGGILVLVIRKRPKMAIAFAPLLIWTGLSAVFALVLAVHN